MSPSRSLPALLLLLVVALAGCLGSSPSPAPTSQNDSPEVVEDPTNYTYVDNASFETGGHVHDYWEGQQRLDVVNRSEQVGFLGAARDEEAEQVGVFRPEAGTTVPQGTASVRVTITWTETETSLLYENPQLRVRTAKTDGFEIVRSIELGETMTIDSANAHNDLPHRQLSAWAFGVYVEPGAAGTTSFQANVQMQVEAIRGLELPVYPAHPDLWDGRSEIPLLDESHGTFVWAGTGPAPGPTNVCANCEGTPPPQHRPDDGTIVPFDAASVRVELTPQTESPTRTGLAYHAADTWNFTRPEPDATDGRTRIYEIPVTPERADGPYDEQSLWRFQVYRTDPVEEGLYAGSYRVTATAVRNVTEGGGGDAT